MISAPAVRIEERDDGGHIANALFRHRYGVDAPDFPHHVLTTWNDGTRDVVLCYIHFTAQGDILLGGGACVDNRAMRHLPADVRAAIRAAGGLYRCTLAWSVRHFALGCAAIFGYCGDALAERADMAVGFLKTRHPHLLVYWTRDTDAVERERMIAEAQRFVPF